jgi:hypothetical protein
MKDNSSPIFQTERYSMFQETEILKDKTSISGRDTEEPIRDGESSMKIKKLRKRPRECMEIMDSTSIEHSTLDQDSQ